MPCLWMRNTPKGPGDPDCDDPAEVCNCRCYMIKGDDDEDDDEEE